MFRQEVTKQKQKSFDFQSPQHHPPNSLISFMNRNHKITRVHTDNSDGKSIQESQNIQSMHNQSNSLQITRGKSKSVYQLFNSNSTPDTPDGIIDSMSIHNTKYLPSKFKISANQLLQQQDNNIIEDLVCFKCKNISDEIKECVGCGHLFCKDCVSQSDNACYDEECCYTFDNQPDKRNLHWELREPSKIIQKKINQLDFKCLNEQLGCNAVLNIKNYADHVDQNCEYVIMECPNQNKECLNYASSPNKQGCLYFGPKKYMQEHLLMCNLKAFNSKDQAKQPSNDERPIELKRIYTDEFNSILHSSQEESNIFERTQLQYQNSQFASKIISIGDEYAQSQMDEIIDLNKKVSNQSQLLTKQSEQIDRQQEENRKLREQIDKISKETDLKISKLQASSTQVMLEMQSMKKMYSDKISELFQHIKEIKGDNSERSMIKSQSGGGIFNKLNNSIMNQTIVSQIASDRSEQNSAKNPKYFSSNQIFNYDQPAIKINSEKKPQNLTIEIKNQQNLTPRSGSLFTAKLEEIKTQNGDNSNKRQNYSGGIVNGQSVFESFENYSSQYTTNTSDSYLTNNQSNNNNNNNINNIQNHTCKQCCQKLIYTPKQFLNICALCKQNQHGMYYCQNCPNSRFYCIECCPLYIRKGYCPNNHVLILQTEIGTAKGGYIHKCNICSKILTDQIISKQYSCSTCDFDLCSGCMNMKYINS